MKKSLLILTTITLIIISCSKDPGSGNGGGNNTTLDCSTVANKSFGADVNPIVQSSCNQAGCHAAGSTNGPGPLTNHAQVFASRVSVRSAIASGRMPQGGGLSIAQKNSILCWIDGGAPNN